MADARCELLRALQLVEGESGHPVHKTLLFDTAPFCLLWGRSPISYRV